MCLYECVREKERIQKGKGFKMTLMLTNLLVNSLAIVITVKQAIKKKKKGKKQTCVDILQKEKKTEL